MLQGEHSAILSTFIKLPSAIKTFVLSIFEWPLKTGLTVIEPRHDQINNMSERPVKIQINTGHPSRADSLRCVSSC